MNRAGYIGGSTVAAILGISPYSSPWAEWASIVGLRGEREDTDRFAIGRDLEWGLARAFTRKTGLHVAGEQMEIVHPRHPMFRAHIDGLAFDGPVVEVGPDGSELGDALAVVEFKTEFGKAWDDPPAHYQAQAQWYMWLTGLERCLFAVLFSGFRFEVYELKADRSDQALIAMRAWRFWRDHCVTGIAPATDGSPATLAALADVYPHHVAEKAVELDANVQEALLRLRMAKVGMREWERRAAEAQAKVEAFLADAEEGTVDGERVVSWRTRSRGAYTVPPGEMRVMRLHTPKQKEVTGHASST